MLLNYLYDFVFFFSQALWFHAHARGPNRHAGRIHYRMEYLARISGERVLKRRRIEGPETGTQDTVGVDVAQPENDPPLNLDELVCLKLSQY